MLYTFAKYACAIPCLAFLLISTGCTYPDLKRPPVRNFIRDARTAHRPPEPDPRPTEELEEAVRAYRGEIEVSPKDYILGPGDVISVKILVPGTQEPDFDLETTITAEGMMRCPLLGEVHVDGLSVADLQEKLEELYLDGYYNQASVEVSVLEYYSKRAMLTGHISSPGQYPIKGERVSLLHLLLEAGGLGGGAGYDISIIRGETPQDMPFAPPERFDIERLVRYGDLERNIWVYPGDIVHVLPESPPEYVYTLGFISNRAVQLPRDRDISLMDLISQVGGVPAVARAQYTSIMRYEDGQPVIYNVDLTRIAEGAVPDIPLQANDRVIVSTDWFRRALDGFGRMGPFRGFVPSPAPIGQ